MAKFIVIVCFYRICHQTMFDPRLPMVVTCFAFNNVSIRFPHPLMKLLCSLTHLAFAGNIKETLMQQMEPCGSC